MSELTLDELKKKYMKYSTKKLTQTEKRNKVIRKKKFKAILNWDSEMGVLSAMWKMKSTTPGQDMSVSDFGVMIDEMLVKTDQINKVILEDFLFDENIRQDIIKKENKIIELRTNITKQEVEVKKINNQILSLEEELEDEDEDEEIDLGNYFQKKQNPIFRSGC